MCMQAISRLRSEELNKTAVFATSKYLRPNFFEIICEIKNYINNGFKIFYR